MNQHTVTATFQAPQQEVFDYLADIRKLPEWATEFARELRLVDGQYKVVNGLGEFFCQLRADPATGVIDMLAGPDRERMLCFPTRVVTTPAGGSAFTFTMFQRPVKPTSSSRASTPPSCASSRTSSGASIAHPAMNPGPDRLYSDRNG